MNNYFACFTLFIICQSCSPDTAKQAKVSEFKVEIKSCLNLLPDFTYNHDAMAGYTAISHGGEDYIRRISNGSIYAFHAGTGAMVDKKEVVAKGPLSVGEVGMFDGIMWINADSTLYSSNGENKIYLIRKDTIITVVDFSLSDDVRLTSSSQNTPIEGKDHYLFPMYAGNKDEIGKGYAFVAIKKDFSGHSSVISFVPAYKDNYYGTIPYFYWPSITYNRNRETYAVSFPINHAVFEYDAAFQLIETHEFFHETMGEINTYDKPLDENGNPNWREDNAYYFSTNYFSGLYYLEDVDQYVRIGRIKTVVKDPAKYCLIVYDGQLSAHKTFMMSADYSMNNIFASGSDLNALNEARLTSDRTIELPFDCISFGQ